jgi:hypothetical protein
MVVGELYYILFDKYLTQPAQVEHGRNGYYFGVSDHYKAIDMSKRMAVVLASAGIGSAEPTRMTLEEASTYLGVSLPWVLRFAYA